MFASTAALPEPALDYFRLLHRWLPTPFFQTPAFLAFFAVVGVVYWLTPRRWTTVRVLWLLAASFHFYAAWNAELAFLVLGTAVIDYLLARWVDATEARRGRVTIAAVSVAMNLGVLAYFKYKGFFLDSLREMLSAVGCEPAFGTAQLIVPFGISFYTFEAISYAVDVCRRTIPAERSLPRFLLFILFFPHLVAGPIVRAKDFLRQTRRPMRLNWVRVQVGVQFFLVGLFKKLAVADRMAVFTDGTAGDGPWFHPEKFGSGSIWLAVLAYSVRIYADFSGYSDMAVGLAHLLGYKLTQNFRQPYLSLNVSDFWNRWHVSLSRWLRDYVYIPLGGNRQGGWATARNLMLTMAAGGLWHGAAWTYVLWGVLHGVMLATHRGFRDWCETRPVLKMLLDTKAGILLRGLLTFAAVSLAWVFFRPDLAGSVEILKRLFVFHGGEALKLPTRSLWWTLGVLLLCTGLARCGAFQRVWAKLPPVVVGVGYAVLLTAAIVLAPQAEKTFIYFTF